MLVKAAGLALLASLKLAQANAEVTPDYASDFTAEDAQGPTGDMEVADYSDAIEPGMDIVPALAPIADEPELVVDMPAVAPVDVADMWEQCQAQLGASNATNSLEDILTGAFQERIGGPSVFIPLLEDLDMETLEILTDFDLSGEGYTLILPGNEARDFNATSPEAMEPVFEVYDFDPNATTPAVVTEVVRAHILPGTLSFVAISAALEENGTYVVQSLQGYEWVFALASGGELLDAANTTATANSTGNGTEAEGGTYPVLLDNHNLTERGFFDIEADISAAQGQCPYAMIISRDGFFAAPQFLGTPEEVPEPIAAPEPLPEVAMEPEPAAETPTGAPLPEGSPDAASGAPDGTAASEENSHAHGAAAGALAASTVAGVAMLVFAMA